MFLGCHLSISGGFYKTALLADSIGANTFQYFTRNPRGGKAKKIDAEDIAKAVEFMKERKFGPLLSHASYTMNLCSDKKEIRDFALDLFKDDLQRLKSLPESLYIFHPGSHVGQGATIGIKWIVQALNEAMHVHPHQRVLLEGMSGKGTEIGSTFEELQTISESVSDNQSLGVCLDTCHLYSAGYDIVNHLDDVLDEFDRTVGLERLWAFHINDSKTPYNSHKDRHAMIGEGELGLKAIVNVIAHPALKDLPLSLETPGESEAHSREIGMIKKQIDTY